MGQNSPNLVTLKSLDYPQLTLSIKILAARAPSVTLLSSFE
jgi:hypothetical protein